MFFNTFINYCGYQRVRNTFARAKRMFWLSAVAAYIANNPKTKKDAHVTMTKLSQLLSLDPKSASLEFPFRVSTRFWHNQSELGRYIEAMFEVGLGDEQKSKAAELVVSVTPRWVRYAETDGMVADLLKITSQ